MSKGAGFLMTFKPLHLECLFALSDCFLFTFEEFGGERLTSIPGVLVPSECFATLEAPTR